MDLRKAIKPVRHGDGLVFRAFDFVTAWARSIEDASSIFGDRSDYVELYGSMLLEIGLELGKSAMSLLSDASKVV
jgi:hypothetical protein